MTSTTFRFTSEEPDQALYTAVGNLNHFTAEQLDAFTDICLSFLSGAVATADDAVGEFAATHGVKEKALRTIIKGVLGFFGAALQRNMSPAHVEADLVALGLDDDKASATQAKWRESFQSLTAAMVRHTLRVDELIDMEWKFGVTASSDECQNVGSCFLQLKLTIDKGGRGRREEVLMELSLPQFYKFLSEMQVANRQCQPSGGGAAPEAAAATTAE